jgi:hypothetical protein
MLKNAALAAATALLLGVGCRNITDAPDTGVTSLTATPPNSLADGMSVVLLSAVVDPALLHQTNEVKFTTTAGTLLPGAAAVSNDSGIARVQLRAPADSAIALVTATAGKVTRSVQVSFAPALASHVEVSSSKFAIKSGLDATTDITAMLLRSVGTPSPGSTVTFSADSLRGSSGDFGRFSNPSVLATTPKVTTQFTAGATSYRGPVVIRATAMRAGQAVTSSTTIQIID